jgi:hypothetical protein
VLVGERPGEPFLDGVSRRVVAARNRGKGVAKPEVALAIETLEVLHRLIKVREEAFL